MLVGLAVAAAGLEALGALLVFYATDQLAGGDATTPLDRFFQSADEPLGAVVVAIAVFFVFRGVFLVASTWFEARTVHLTSARISERLFRRYVTAPYPEYLRRNSAELIRNAVTSVEGVAARYLTPIVAVSGEIIVIVFLVVVLAAAAPLATLSVAVVLGLVGYGLLRFVRSRLRRYGALSERATEASLSILQQSLQDLRSIRVFGREEYFAARFDVERRRFARSRYALATFSQLPRAVVETLIFVMLAVFVTVTSPAGAAESIGVLGLFAYAALRIMPGVNKVISGLNLIRYGGASVDNVIADLATPSPPLDRAGAGRDRLTWSSVEFLDVDFGYDLEGVPAVTGLDITLESGEMIGVVGHTGSGKSTFIDLLIGLQEPGSGTIRVDGTDLADVRGAWQREIGIVSQDVYLLDDTIRRNVAFGLGDKEIDDEHVWRCLRLAQVAHFVEETPRGLDTRVGERGVAVSGGERQRIAIARALYREPSVIVLDEGTSALDTSTERDVLGTLGGADRDETVVLVAHRLSTVRACDRIAVFERGRIVDCGSYETLALRCAAFRELLAAVD
jgi:ABC-type multidrug transport system fused ATPase/permease subunit